MDNKWVTHYYLDKTCKDVNDEYIFDLNRKRRRNLNDSGVLFFHQKTISNFDILKNKITLNKASNNKLPCFKEDKRILQRMKYK